jgi:hypothetical protein
MPHHKTLDEYDFAHQPELDPRRVRDLATLLVHVMGVVWLIERRLAGGVGGGVKAHRPRSLMCNHTCTSEA